MDRRHLEIFVAVAESGSMSSAAKHLFISQPTISQSIRELEAHYGLLLFERLSKRLAITVAGEKLYTLAKEVLTRFDNLETAMGELKATYPIAVGASLTVGSCLFPELLYRYKQLLPGAETISTIHNTAVIEEKLLRGKLDIAVVEGEITSDELITRSISEDELVLVCGKEHPFWGRESLAFSELAGCSFAMREQGSGTRALFEQDLVRHGIEVRYTWEISNTEGLLHGVLCDRCLAVVSYSLVSDLLEKGQLYAFRNENPHWRRTFKLAYHKNKYITKGMGVFMETALSCATTHLPPAECGRLYDDHSRG